MKYRPVINERIHIAFLFQIASFWPSWESFYHSCMEDKRFEVKLFFVQDGIDISQHTKSAENFLLEQDINFAPFSDDAFEDFKPHIAVVQTPYESLHRKPHLYSLRLKMMGVRVVYIPYGIEIADTRSARYDHFREAVLRNAWRIYTLSDEFKREYEKYCDNAKAVRAFGLPRFDALIRKDRFVLDRKLIERINGRKIIVWHAHFAKTIIVDGKSRQVTPYLDEYISFAESLALYKDAFFFIFLPHPRFGDDALDDLSNLKSAELLRIIGLADNAYIDTSDDYRPSLLNADAIITDRSALMVEAAMTGVPILYLKNPDYEEPVFPPLIKLIDSYYQGTCRNEMTNFVRQFQAGADGRAQERADALAKCVSNIDGQCGRRIKDDILNSIDNDQMSPPPVKRIIIFGLGILYNKIMNYFTFPDSCRIVALSVSNKEKWHTRINGIDVVPPQQLRNIDFDKIIIMALHPNEEEIYQLLRFDLEIPDSKIEYCEYLAVLEKEKK